MDERQPVRGWRRLAVPAACLLVFGLVAWVQRPDGHLHIYIPPVPGTTLLIQTPGGQFVLIDGGRDPAGLTLALGRLIPVWRRDLRAAVLTRPDGRRLPGQVAALARYQPELALAPPHLGDSGFAGEWRRLVATAEVTTRTLAPGQRLALDGATLTVLGTHAGDEGGAVLLLTYGATRAVLHTGGPAGDTDARNAARRPADLLVYPWQRELATPAVASLRPRAIVFTDSFEAHEPALLSFADRRRVSPRVYHPTADGLIEWVSDGRRTWVRTNP